MDLHLGWHCTICLLDLLDLGICGFNLALVHIHYTRAWLTVPRFILVWGVTFVILFGIWFTQRNKGSEYEEVGEDVFEPRPLPTGYYPGVSNEFIAESTLGTTPVSFQNSVPTDFVPDYQPEQDAVQSYQNTSQ